MIEFALDYSRASIFYLSHLWACWILSLYFPGNAVGFYLYRPRAIGFTFQFLIFIEQLSFILAIPRATGSDLLFWFFFPPTFKYLDNQIWSQPSMGRRQDFMSTICCYYYYYYYYLLLFALPTKARILCLDPL
jgi:hypothetical protein